MKIAIVGAGGVGGFLAGALDRCGHEIVVIARGNTARILAADGLRIHSAILGSFVAHPRIVTYLDGDAEALVLATKAHDLKDSLGAVGAITPALVLPLLNGLDHLALLRERFGDSVVAGSIRIESYRAEPGVIDQPSPLVRVEMASRGVDMRDRMMRLTTVLNGAGVPTHVSESEAQVMWSKLVRLNALACTTSAFDLSIGRIRSDSATRTVLCDAVEEGAQVAAMEGASVSASRTISELDDVHPELSSSMRRDIAAGRTPELDAIPGAVVRAARRHACECPTVEALMKQIRERSALTVAP